jgi:hypothetical protein
MNPSVLFKQQSHTFEHSKRPYTNLIFSILSISTFPFGLHDGDEGFVSNAGECCRIPA